MKNKKLLPQSKVYSLLESGPVILVSTARKEKNNIMSMSWHMMMDFEPPLVGIIMGDQSYSCDTLKKTKECVINIPTVEFAKQVVNCGNCSGRDIDKFIAFGFTPEKASTVHAPLIKECYANLECKVVDTRMASKYGMFVLQVLKAWVNPSIKNPKTIHHRGGPSFFIAGRAVKIPSGKK